MRAGICLNCKRELKYKKIFGFKIKWCSGCLEFKKKNKEQL